MTILSGIVMYFLIWWTVIFTVLPWRASPSKNPLTGNAASAPDNANLKIKFLITTAISAVVWLVLFLLIHFNVLPFRQWAEMMG